MIIRGLLDFLHPKNSVINPYYQHFRVKNNDLIFFGGFR